MYGRCLKPPPQRGALLSRLLAFLDRPPPGPALQDVALQKKKLKEEAQVSAKQNNSIRNQGQKGKMCKSPPL
jgi:hypothetical protein